MLRSSMIYDVVIIMIAERPSELYEAIIYIVQRVPG